MTKSMREKLKNYLLSVSLLLVGSVIGHFFWWKEASAMEDKSKYDSKADKIDLQKTQNKVEDLEKTKLDKSTYEDHIKQQAIDREEDYKKFIGAVQADGAATRSWINIVFKKNEE
jgi:hypothetical protein